MVDVVKPEVRSRMMSRIRGRDTQPERLIRSGLWAHGFRFQLHKRELPGRPDLVLPKWRTVVFVNGCFWHAHEGCPYFRLPASRPDFWKDKLEKNRRRDVRAVNQLVAEEWKVITVWECALRADANQAVSLTARLIREPSKAFVWDIRQAPAGAPNLTIESKPSASAQD